MADPAEQIRYLVASGMSPEAAAARVASGNGPSPALPVNPVDAAINATAAQAGMDPRYWRAIAHIESSLKPGSNAYNPATQYKGLFQIGSRGSRSEWATHGSGNIYDPMDNATAAAKLAAENNAWFKNAYGHDPTPIQTYMMHQQGPGFYSRGAMTNIAGNLPPEDRTPENMTHSGFERYWARKLEQRANMPEGSLQASVGSVPVGSGGDSGGPGIAPSAQRNYQASLPANAPLGTPSPMTAGAAPSVTSDQTSQGQGLASIAKLLGQSDQQNQPPPLPPMQMAQPMQTPAMQRARMLAQAMLNQQMGVTPPTGDTAS